MTKKQDTAIYGLMNHIAANPKGVMGVDFPAEFFHIKSRALRPLIARGVLSCSTESRRNRYTVSEEQWQKYKSEKPKPNLMCRAAYRLLPGSGPSRTKTLYELASQPKGTDCHSYPDQSIPTKSISMSLALLCKKGILVRIEVGGRHPPRYFVTKEQAAASGVKYTAPKRKQTTSDIPATFRFTEKRKKDYEKTKQESRAAWLKKKMVIPDHVQIQHAPKPRGRYEVTGPVIGGWLTEWHTLRA